MINCVKTILLCVALKVKHYSVSHTVGHGLEPGTSADSETLSVQSGGLRCDRASLDLVVLTRTIFRRVAVEHRLKVAEGVNAVVLVNNVNLSVGRAEEVDHRTERRKHVAVNDDSAVGGLPEVKTDSIRDIFTLDGEICEIVGAHDFLFSVRL